MEFRQSRSQERVTQIWHFQGHISSIQLIVCGSRRALLRKPDFNQRSLTLDGIARRMRQTGQFVKAEQSTLYSWSYPIWAGQSYFIAAISNLLLLTMCGSDRDRL